MPLLFAYGTLLDDAVQRVVFGRGVASRRDLLVGYVVSCVPLDDAGTYPNVVSTGQPTDVVVGAVLHLNDAELHAADVYETSAYERRTVTLASGTTAWVYVAGRPAAPAVASGRAEQP